MGENGFDRAARSPTQVERDGEHARAAVADAEKDMRPSLERTLSTAGLHHRQKKSALHSSLSLPLSCAGTSQSDETSLPPRDFRDRCAK